MENNNEGSVDGTVSIGIFLSEARVVANISIDDVVRETKIRSAYIEAMEADNFAKLPSGVYTKNYLKTYVKFLGLDENFILSEFKKVAEFQENKAKKTLTPEPYRVEMSPGLFMIIASISMAILIYLIFQDTPDVTVVTDNHSEKVVAVFTNPNPTVTFVAGGDVKLTILNPDEVILTEKNMTLGDTYFLPSKKGLILKADNMEALEIYIDGELVASTDNLEKKAGGLVLDIQKMLAALEIN